MKYVPMLCVCVCVCELQKTFFTKSPTLSGNNSESHCTVIIESELIFFSKGNLYETVIMRRFPPLFPDIPTCSVCIS